MKTPRSPLDFYPTPEPVASILRDWMAEQVIHPAGDAHFLDPAAGVGHLIDAWRGRVWGESLWHAIEISPDRTGELELRAENVIEDNALVVDWPEAHVIMNPPFSLLDGFWIKMAEHRLRYGVWCASLTPVAWWNAEKRRSYTKPDHILALGWRPSFRDKSGPAHKGSQDFCWSVLAPEPTSRTTWERIEKPSPYNGSIDPEGPE